MKRKRLSQHLENVKKLELLDSRELERAIRDAMIAEQEAVKQYETIVNSINAEFVKEVLQGIANEEKVHMGELQELLRNLSPEEENFLEEGKEEVEENTDEIIFAKQLVKIAREILS